MSRFMRRVDAGEERERLAKVMKEFITGGLWTDEHQRFFRTVGRQARRVGKSCDEVLNDLRADAETMIAQEND